MKLFAAILSSVLFFSPSSFATNHHFHANDKLEEKPKSSAITFPGYCEIEIVNRSFDNVRVYGVFDDGLSMDPFNVYSFELPHYIPLFYYGYCHDGMDLYIDSFSGYPIFSGYVPRATTIRIVSSRQGVQPLNVELQAKQ